MNTLPCYKGCFFCGPEGDGLKMRLEMDGDVVFSRFVLDARIQGYDNVAHGGIVSGIVDEVMWWTIFALTRRVCYTRKMEMEFLRPVLCGAPYRAEGSLGEVRRGNIRASATITDEGGQVAARGSGLFMPARDIVTPNFLKKLDFTRVAPDLEALFRAALIGG